MSIIGTFSKSADGYSGTIRTLTINVKATLVANDKNGNEKAPDFKLFAAGKEFGAAWLAQPKDSNKKPYLRVELDDPSFAAPLRAAFFENSEEDTGVLVWNRQ